MLPGLKVLMLAVLKQQHVGLRWKFYIGQKRQLAHIFCTKSRYFANPNLQLHHTRVGGKHKDVLLDSVLKIDFFVLIFTRVVSCLVLGKVSAMEHRFVRRAIESDSDFAFWRFSPDNQTDWVEKPIIVPSCHRGPKCFEVDWNWLNIWSLEENVSSPVSPPGEEGDGFVVDSKLFLQIMKMFQLPQLPNIIRWVLNTLSHKVRHWRPELPSVYFLELDDLSGFERVSQMLKKLIVNSLLTGNWFSNLEPAARCDANRVSSSRYSKLSERRSSHHTWCCI